MMAMSPKIPEIEALERLILFCFTKNCLRSSPASTMGDCDKPIIYPPKTQPQIEMPILSIETSDCA